MARPTKFTDEVQDKLRTAYMFGATNSEAVAYAEISERVLYDYFKEYPEFLQKTEEWKLNPLLKAKKTIVDNLTDTKNAQWYLERRAKKDYGNNVDVTSDGKQLPTPILANVEPLDDIRTDNSST